MDIPEGKKLIENTLNRDLKSYSLLMRNYQGHIIACLALRLESQHEAEDLLAAFYCIKSNYRYIIAAPSATYLSLIFYWRHQRGSWCNDLPALWQVCCINEGDVILKDPLFPRT